MNLFQEFEERKIDYETVNFEYIQTGKFDVADVCVIIPVHGRTQFNQIVTDAITTAANKYGRQSFKVSIVFVEHSEQSEHNGLCREWVDHIWIPKGADRFNKCLCFNIGVLYGPPAKQYLFHDGDILIPTDFFWLLAQNMVGRDAVQAFSGQRLFHCGRDLTGTLLNRALPVELLSTDTIGVLPARAGAEGGSIFCTKDLLLKTGLFPDWGMTEYSVEDAFFWRLINLMGNVGFCNQPPIDCFHLWHEPSFNRQTKNEDWLRYHAFMAMNEEGKRHYCKLASDHFKKYL